MDLVFELFNMRKNKIKRDKLSYQLLGGKTVVVVVAAKNLKKYY